MHPRLPSLHVTGQRGPDEIDLDLALVRAVQKLSDEDEYYALPNDDMTCMELKQEFFWEVSTYLSDYYCQLGKTWVNPTRLFYLNRRRGQYTHIRHSHGNLLLDSTSYSYGQIASFIRRAGLVEIGGDVLVCLDEVIEHRPADMSLRFWGPFSLHVLPEAHTNLLNLLEVSDWLPHRDGAWSNPAQVRMLSGEEAIYTSDYTRHLAELKPEAVATVQDLPWMQVDEDTQINIDRVIACGKRRPDDHLAVVLMGAGVQHPISLEMNEKISLILRDRG